MNATDKLDELGAFVAVAAAGSFTAAALQTEIPKSTLSRAVTRLEEQLKTRLLMRASRTLTLTEAGRSLYAQAAPHIEGLKQVTRALRERQDLLRGTIRLTCPVDIGVAHLGELLTHFVVRYPGLRVELDASARVVDLVAEGFDAALRAMTRPTGTGLIVRKLMDSEGQLFAAPSYIARKGMPKVPAELTQHDLVTFRADRSGVATLELTGSEGVQRVDVQGRLSAGEFMFVRAALMAGAGIGPLPSFMAQEELQSGRLVRVLPAYRLKSGSLYFVYPAGRHTPRRVLALRDFLIEGLAQHAT